MFTPWIHISAGHKSLSGLLLVRLSAINGGRGRTSSSLFYQSSMSRLRQVKFICSLSPPAWNVQERLQLNIYLKGCLELPVGLGQGVADAAQVEGLVPAEGRLMDFDPRLLQLLPEVVEEALRAAWRPEALGEVGVGVEEHVAASDSGGVHLDVLDELLGDLVGPPLVALLVADEADQDVLELLLLWAGGLLGHGRLFLDLVAEVGAV
jgi:hypothetical protein